MKSEKLIDTLNKLLALHQSLHKLGTQKTEVIKKGDIEALSSILKDENKHVMAINKLEEERKQQVMRLVSGHAIKGDEPTLTDVIEGLSSEEADKLVSLRDQLYTQLEELKSINTLNQELVYSSLQFVNYSLDLLMPRTQNMNYNKPTNKGQAEPVKRSVFDSKA
ncbi:flagellar biosynthesis/type III secretory pathway chaperone [Bacillus mesophilus]|uniref:Flagellar protein FlgN n=1 Tax=Bacillus mesophilus TaxID=1808955 RepID=A0A6M0Q7K3_9BACI|nr:flagellar protein FlgN [Bacillus mesophilus]MBM7661594.1 flagellar biosynthesis/type III secretory pathway chaperone [Bacillus mesophilus]NEY72263.1 flagellar protein FlgN [Bacillus mesophilus]